MHIWLRFDRHEVDRFKLVKNQKGSEMMRTCFEGDRHEVVWFKLVKNEKRSGMLRTWFRGDRHAADWFKGLRNARGSQSMSFLCWYHFGHYIIYIFGRTSDFKLIALTFTLFIHVRISLWKLRGVCFASRSKNSTVETFISPLLFQIRKEETQVQRNHIR